MANKGNHEPCAIKNTFWNRQRVAKRIKLSELANLLGCGVSTIGSYFSGQHVPSEDTINQLCILLDVDPLEGAREFIKANDAWDTTRGKEARVVCKSVSEKSEVKPVKVAEELQVKSAVPLNNARSVPDSVLEVLYNNLPYELFKAIYEDTEGKIDPLEYLYNRIGFAEYNKIYKAIKEVK